MRAAGLGNSGALTVLAAGNFIDVAYDRKWVVSISFNSPGISSHTNPKPLLRRTSLNLSPEAAPSNPRSDSPTLVQKVLPRSCMPLLRGSPRSSSQVIPPSPGRSTTSGPALRDARSGSSENSKPLLRLLRLWSSRPTGTLAVSQLPHPDTRPGSVPTMIFAKRPSRASFRISVKTPTSRHSTTFAIATKRTPPPMSVRRSLGRETTVLLLMNLFARPQRTLGNKDLPRVLGRASQLPDHNTYPRGYPLPDQRQHHR